MTPEELKKVLHGVIVLIMTPFDDELNLDIPSLRKEVKFLLDNGLKRGNAVLVPMGSAGEFPMLTLQERKRILEVILEKAEGRIPVVSTCCHTNIRAVIELMHHAESVGVAGAMVSPPYYYNGLNEEAVLQWYKTIAKATNLGMIVYNNYFATQLDIPLSIIEKLTQSEKIVGFKEITCNYEKIHRLTEITEGRIVILNGTSERNEPYASFMGTKGFFTSLPNYAPKFSLQMWQLVSKANYEEAKKLHFKLMPLFRLISFGARALRGNNYVKEAMKMRGIISSSSVRPPLLSINEEERQKLRNELKKLGLLS